MIDRQTERPHKGAPLWSIILAGGEGERVRRMIERWLGCRCPKQYCAFVGTRSMFQHTVDRAACLSPPDHIVAVVAQAHRPQVLRQLAGRRVGPVLFQPVNRDTMAGVFLPLAYVRATDPTAVVVLFPSDHFINPEERFLTVVRHAAHVARRFPTRLVLLGVQPDRLELEYGWIERDQVIEESPDQPVHTVRSFLEKPDMAQADAALRKGALWNTLVLAASVDALWQAGRRCAPDIMMRFEVLTRAIGSSREGHVLSEIYQDMPSQNFSSELLERIPNQVAVMELTGVLWSDWGKPGRIAETLRRIGKSPNFPLECLDQPLKPIGVTA